MGMTKTANQNERRGFPITSQNDRKAVPLESNFDYILIVINWLAKFAIFGITFEENMSSFSFTVCFLLEERPVL